MSLKCYILPNRVVAYIDDHLGLLAIVTEDSAYTHRWGTSVEYLGAPTLTAALRDRYDVDYVTDKLLYQSVRCEYDEKATIDAVKEAVLRARRQREVDAEDARAAWNALKVEGLPSAENAYTAACNFSSYPAECIRERPTRAAQDLHDKHVPALLAALRKATNDTEEPETAV